MDPKQGLRRPSAAFDLATIALALLASSGRGSPARPFERSPRWRAFDLACSLAIAAHPRPARLALP